MIVSPEQIVLDAASSQLQLVSLLSSSPSTLIYKIRTTNPKKFIVKPAMGYLRPSQAQQIRILIQDKEHFVKERFQIIFQEVSSIKECQNHWRSLEKQKNQEIYVDVYNTDNCPQETIDQKVNESRMFQTVVNQPINNHNDIFSQHKNSETNSLFQSKYLDEPPQDITVNKFNYSPNNADTLKSMQQQLDSLSQMVRQIDQKVATLGTGGESTLPLIYLLIGIIIINFMAIIFKK